MSGTPLQRVENMLWKNKTPRSSAAFLFLYSIEGTSAVSQK
jgi:hypothetical protein